MGATTSPIDLDLLPGEYRRRALSGRSMLLILVAVLALLPLYPMVQAKHNMGTETAQLQSNLKRMKAQTAELKVNEAQVKSLQAAVADAQQRLSAMQKDYKALDDGRVNWQPVLNTVYSALPSTVAIEQIVQQGAKLTVQGKAQSYEAIVAYAKQLRESGSFTGVSPQFGEMAVQSQQGTTSKLIPYILTLQAKAGTGAEK